MLTLKNFEEQIGGVILKRGLQYYKQGAVVDLEESGAHTWQAEVEGSELLDKGIENAVHELRESIV